MNAFGLMEALLDAIKIKEKNKMKPKSIWMHSKYPNREYTGSFETVTLTDKKTKAKFNQRIFVLMAKLKNGKIHSVEFGDFRYAKNEGWVKVK